jgi:hypothetical protein
MNIHEYLEYLEYFFDTLPGLATLVADKFDEMKYVVEACSQRFGSPFPVRLSSSMGELRLLRLELLAQKNLLLRMDEQREWSSREVNRSTNSAALRLWHKISTFLSW